MVGATYSEPVVRRGLPAMRAERPVLDPWGATEVPRRHSCIRCYGTHRWNPCSEDEGVLLMSALVLAFMVAIVAVCDQWKPAPHRVRVLHRLDR